MSRITIRWCLLLMALIFPTLSPAAGDASFYWRNVTVGGLHHSTAYSLPVATQRFNDNNKAESLVVMRKSDNTVIHGYRNFGATPYIYNPQPMTFPRNRIDWNSFAPARGLVSGAAVSPNMENNSVVIRRKDGKEGYSSNQVQGSNQLWNKLYENYGFSHKELDYSTNRAHKTVVAGNLRSTNTDDLIVYSSFKYEFPFASNTDYEVGHIYLMKGNNNGVDVIPLASSSGGGIAVGAFSGSNSRIALGLGDIYPNKNPDLVFMSAGGMQYPGNYFGGKYPSNINFLMWVNSFPTPDYPYYASSSSNAIGGMFPKKPNASGILPGVIDFTIADLNGNGRGEIIAVVQDGLQNSGIYLGELKVDNSSQYPTDWYIDFTKVFSFLGATGVVAGDINRTGRKDLFITGQMAGNAAVLYNRSNPSRPFGIEFSDPRYLVSPFTSNGEIPMINPLLADLDGDGDLDFIMAGRNNSYIYTVENQSPTIGPKLESITRHSPSLAHTNSGTLQFTMTFDRIANGLKKEDLLVAGTYRPQPGIHSISQSSDGKSYTVEVRPSASTTIAGTIGINFKSTDPSQYPHIKDDWGNALHTIETPSRQAYIVDRRQPRLLEISRTSPSGSAMAPGQAQYRLNFNKQMNNPPSNTGSYLAFAPDNEATGASFGSISRNSNGTSYDLTVNTGEVPGMLIFKLDRPGGITDEYGNTLDTRDLPKTAKISVLGPPSATYSSSGGVYTLTLNAFGNESSAHLTRSGSSIYLNGARPYSAGGTLLSVPYNQVNRIVYNGASGPDTLNLSSLSRSDLPALTEIVYNGGSGGASTVSLPNFNASGAGAVDITATAPSSGNHTLTIPGPGHDHIVLNGSRAGQSADGRLSFNNFNYLNLGSGDNTLEVASASSGFQVIDAKGGKNTLLYTRTSMATIDLSSNDLLVGASSAQTTIKGFGHATVTSGASVNMIGTSSGNTLTGGPGNNTINGTGGNNTMAATGGTNTINGGAGNDTLIAGTGDDTLAGGGGNDRYVFPANTGGTNTIVESPANGEDILDMTALSGNHTITMDTSGLHIDGGSYTIESGSLNVETMHLGSGADTFNISASGPREIGMRGAGDTTYNITLTDDMDGDISINELPSGGNDTVNIHEPNEGGELEIRPTGLTRLSDDFLVAYNQNVETISFTGSTEDDTTITLIPTFPSHQTITLDGGEDSYNKLIVATPDSSELVENFTGPRSGTLEQGDFAVVAFENFDEVVYDDVITDYILDGYEIISEGIFANGDGTFRAVAPVTINDFLVYRMGNDVQIDPYNHRITGAGGFLVIADMDGIGDYSVARGAFQINTLTDVLTDDEPSLALGGIELIPTSQVIDGSKLVVEASFDHESIENESFKNTVISGLEFSADGITLANGYYQLGPLNAELFQFTPDEENYTADTFQWNLSDDNIPGNSTLTLTVGGVSGEGTVGGTLKADCDGEDCITISILSPTFPDTGGIYIQQAEISGISGATISATDLLITESSVSLAEGTVDVAGLKIDFSNASFGHDGVTADSADLAVGTAVSIDLSDLVANRNGVDFTKGDFTLSGFEVVLEDFSFDEVNHTLQAGSATATVGDFELILQDFSVNSNGTVNVTGASITEGDITLALFDPEFLPGRITVGEGEITGIADTTFTVASLSIRDGNVSIGSGKATVASFDIDIENGNFSSSGVSVAEADLQIAGQSIELTDFVANSGGVTLGAGKLAISGFSMDLENLSFLTSPNRFAAEDAALHVDGIGDVSIQNLHVDSSGHVSATGGSFDAGPISVALSNPDFQSDHVFIGHATLEVDGQGFDVTNLRVVSNGVTLDSGSLHVAGVELNIDTGVFLDNGFSATHADISVADVGSVNAENISVSGSGFSIERGGFEFAGFAIEIGAGTPEGGEGLRLSCLLQLPDNMLGAKAGITFTIIDDKFKLEAFEFCTPQNTFVASSNFSLPALCFAYYQDEDGEDVWEGSGEFKIPGTFAIDGSFKIVDGFLDMIGVGVDDLNLAIGDTGAFLQSIHADVGNLSREVRHWTVNVPVLGKQSGFGIPPVFFEGVVSATAGPEVAGQSLMRGTVTMYFDQDQMALKGSVEVLIVTIGEAWFWAKYADRAAGFGGWMTYSVVLEGGGEVRVQIGGSVSGSAYLAVKLPDDVPFVGGKSVGEVDAGFHTHPTEATASFKILSWKVGMTISQGHVHFGTKDLRSWERPHRHVMPDKDGRGYITFNDNTIVQDRVYSDGESPEKSLAAKTGDGVYTVNVEGDAPLIIRVNYELEAGKPDFRLTAPDGSIYEPDFFELNERDHDQFAHWFHVPGALDGGYLIPKALEGSYTVELLAGETLGEHVLEVLRQIPPPEVEITNVHADGMDLGIEWFVDHVDENTTVTLYLDRDRHGFIGDALAGPFTGQQGVGAHAIDLVEENLVPGVYYVYIAAKDGINPPVRRYFDTPIFIGNVNAPAAVEQLEVSIEDGVGIVAFNITDNAKDIVSYRLDYSDQLDRMHYREGITIPADSNSGIIEGLVDGRNYRFRLIPVRQLGRINPGQSDLIELVKNAAEPYIQGKAGKSAKSMHRNELVKEMRSAITSEITAKGLESLGGMSDNQLQSLAQQAAMTAIYNSKLEMSKPSKHLEMALQDIRLKRDTKATTEGFLPLEAPPQVSSFEMFSHTSTARMTDGNSLPIVYSNAPPTGLVGTPYTYQIIANDGQGTELGYNLVDGPAGMTVSSTGLVSYTPDEPGATQVVVEISDDVGSVLHEWALHVGTIDVYPRLWFATNPVTWAIPGEKYVYDFDVRGGVPGGMVDVTLLEAPDGMHIDPETGQLVWEVPEGQLQNHRVVILATQDAPEQSFSSEAIQSFHLDVTVTDHQNIVLPFDTRVTDWSLDH
ncbi:MAG: calcium-binding protein [Candidatus Sumerlaeia bacterium]|nr:calcium-binding protein [Candidatus Sumerlaeia bacterium]